MHNALSCFLCRQDISTRLVGQDVVVEFILGFILGNLQDVEEIAGNQEIVCLRKIKCLIF